MYSISTPKDFLRLLLGIRNEKRYQYLFKLKITEHLSFLWKTFKFAICISQINILQNCFKCYFKYFKKSKIFIRCACSKENVQRRLYFVIYVDCAICFHTWGFLYISKICHSDSNNWITRNLSSHLNGQ